MTLRDRIARAIAPYEAEPTSATLATADRVIAALREPGEATIDELEMEIVQTARAKGQQQCCGFGQGSPPECCGNPDLWVCVDDAVAASRAAYAAIWSEK